MSGHSKWHKIQHKKGKADKARSGSFTKLLKAVEVAAMQGGSDADMNFSLRLAVEKAKASNVPKDNIQRAIKRGAGELDGEAAIEQIIYEGYGPGGIAVLVECNTNNRNRTVAEVKHAFSKYGGSMGASGSVQWQFEHLAVIIFDSERKSAIDNWDEFEMSLIESGASDVLVSNSFVEIRGPKESFQTLVEAVETAGIVPEDSGLKWVAKDSLGVDEPTTLKMETLYEKLDELDDVSDVYTNEA